ncbi:perilipin-2-like [Brachionichthys hirsutus]|uniref:perilipin-2-like n=1 Tax=Brachionichthys hirsutus TaxID=412623 RepID=UPI0036050AB1
MSHHETSAVLRVSRLPLVSSALQSVTSVYSEVKGRYPLLGLMGVVAEVGVHRLSHLAMRRATPLLQILELQIGAANSFALIGLDRLERTLPILNQSTDEVMAHLKEALFLTLDDVQLWVGDGLDGALDQLQHLSHVARDTFQQLQDTQVGQAATSGLDDILSGLEEAAAYYLPLPPTLRWEWEMRLQEDEEDEEDEEEPGLRTRARGLLLSLSLQLHHRLSKVRGQLQNAIRTLGDAAGLVVLDRVLDRVLDVAGELLQNLKNLLVVLLYQAEGLRQLTLNRVKGQAQRLAELPVQIQQVLRDLQELSKLLLQLLVNATPLYDSLQRPTDQDVEDFLNQEEVPPDTSCRRSSANSLFLKAMDGRPRRRRSLHSRAARALGSPDPPNDPPALDGMSPPPDLAQRRPSTTELLLSPLKQFVTQSQKAFEYLSPNSPDGGGRSTPTAN